MRCGHFLSNFGIGDRVNVIGLPATVLSVTFTKDRVLYDVEFDNGGAKGRHESSEVAP
jgi:hypothetical protein